MEIVLQKVLGLEWAGGRLDTVVLAHKCASSSALVPLLAPSLWLLSKSKHGRSFNTVSNYANALKIFFSIIEKNDLGENDWKCIGDREMSTYLFSYLQQTRQLSDKSISRDITVLDSFYNWAYKKGFAVSRPTFSFTYEKKNRRNRQGGSSAHSIKRMHKEYIDQESFEFLLENVTNKNPFINERNCLTLELGYKLGLRAAEVTHPKNLNTTKLRNLIENEPTGSSIEIDIFGKRNKWRTVIVPPDLVDNIDRFLNKRRKYYPDGPLICSTKGKILSASFASKVFRKCRIHTNSEEWKDRRFHSLRKSFATNLVAWCYLHGIDPWQMVPERMGHESSETTKIYVFFDAVYNMRTDVIRTLSLENYSFNFNKKRLRKNEKK